MAIPSRALISAVAPLVAVAGVLLASAGRGDRAQARSEPGRQDAAVLPGTARLRFGCDQQGRIRATLVAGGRLTLAVSVTAGAVRTRFPDSARRLFVAPPQRAPAAQVWRIASRSEEATVRSVMTVDYRRTAGSGRCYVARVAVVTRTVPHER